MSPPSLKAELTGQHTLPDGLLSPVGATNIRPEMPADARSEVIAGVKNDAEALNKQSHVNTPSANKSATCPTIDSHGLSWPGPGTISRKISTEKERDERLDKLAGAVRTVLECIGEDPNREGLLRTPERYAKSMLFFTKGYEQDLRTLVNDAIFHEEHEELVVVKNIEFFSLCEHHLVPFFGKMHVGYVPGGRVIGLSKIVRVVEMFSHRLQIQERLTKQIAHAISEITKPQGVAVVAESSHLCMAMRGVERSGAITTTSCMLGQLQTIAKTKDDFLGVIGRR